VQGRLVGYGLGSAKLVDEQQSNKSLLCRMTADEFDEVIHLYHVGEVVQADAEYAGQAELPVFDNCRLASPTANVVRPAQVIGQTN
jgi:hypothetical protein